MNPGHHVIKDGGDNKSRASKHNRKEQDTQQSGRND
jgi:hypothetical protein